MALYPIKSLGAVGVIADQAPTDLAPNAFTNAINARFVEQRVFKTGGNAPLSYVDEDKDLTPLSFLSMPFDYYSAGTSFLVVGTDKKLYKLTDESLTDISRKVATATKKASATIKIYPVVSSISPKETSVSMNFNQTKILEVEVKPVDAQNANLVWEVSNSSYGSIEVDPTDSKKATLTSKSVEGNLVVTVSTADDSISAQIAVNIIDGDSGIYLSQDTLTMRKGGTSTLTAITGKPSVTWTSSNPSLISVSPNANTKTVVLTALGEGQATITADNGTKTASCVVTAIPQIDSISLSQTDVQMSRGTQYILTATVSPANAPNQAITWTSSNTNIATVSGTGTEATITGLLAGYTEITAVTAEGSRSAVCTVRVDLSSRLASRAMSAMAITTEAPVEEPVVESEEVTYFDTDTIGIDTSGMSEGNNFYDYSNVMDLEGFGRAAMLANDPPLTGVTLDVIDASLDVGEEIVITATASPTGSYTYKWTVDKSGYVSTTSTTNPTLKLTAIRKGEIKVTCTVSQMVQKDYDAFEDYPWYHAIISNCAVATTHYETPQVKEFDSEYFTDLPGWGEQTVVDADGNPSVKKYNWKCERVRAFNNRLFALNMRESNASGVTTHYPLRLRWSNFAEENKAPELWDDYAYDRAVTSDLAANIVGQTEALENGYAGYIDLADSNGSLLDVLPLKDYLFVYTEFETYIGSPTNNTYQPLMFKKLFNDSGILAPECVVEVEGGHFVVTQNDVILHNGASKKSIASNRVKNMLINEICLVNPIATRVHLHQDKKEVWVLYVGPGEPKESFACTKAAVWNYEFDTWSFRTIPYSYCIGLVDPPVLERGPIWADFQEITWDDPSIDKLVWRKDATNFRQRVTIIGSFLKGFYQVDIGALDYIYDRTNDVVIEKPLEMRLERTGIDFDNVTNEWNQKHINRFRPQVTGTGTYTFEAGGSQFSNEYGHNHSTKEFRVGVDRHVAVRLNHPYLFYNVIDNDVNSNASMNGLTIEFAVGGRR
ncbi:tail fiber protein; host specificity [Escherichia phage ECBP2]|uniref:Cell adhesion domain protein n=1 Tax=Escherichia phage ECBP2 TaxID=1604355 RepID=J9SN50_9CAUD|nr:tail fiber protein; host specificity [Escherichia phage ECBP2]AFR52050.1 cell adhesion domain protein [Escherichia phage ECBP2]